ncbi:membrane dipeptidase [Petrotoga sp. HKA.pet.4.5]|uniref:dipeptidase n=1 Tax=unclassified Petrotoga TaxID=2620614 RepID=UPI000EF15106|nr:MULTISPECIES: dipeptidase [unclassified Petrotoga]RLL85436.1 membrane dipeptidase [Petrotoga sp. Shatin.DS.tank11.9.2.9.3]RLL88784.1 membrane dipeptidase [Petrotoga sp. HKA.pet.4.5]
MTNFKEQAHKILEESLVIDAHFDLLMDVANQRKYGIHKVIENDHLDNFRKGGLNAVVSSLFIESFLTPEISLREALDQISSFYQELEESSDYLMLCKSYEDIIKAKESNKIGIFLSFEGVEPLYNDLDLLDIFYRLGVRFVGLTWSRRNYAGDGSKFLPPDPKKNSNGLSDFGIDLVKKAQSLGMVIDVSHLNDKGFWQVIELSKGPIIASHSDCRKIVNLERNLSDSQIKAIADTDGVIGINAYNKIVSNDPEKANVDDLVKHIDHIVNLVGIEYVGLGFDFCEHLKKFNPQFVNELNPSPSFQVLDNHSNIVLLVEKLLQSGYGEQDIKKILGENFSRVYKKVLID